MNESARKEWKNTSAFAALTPTGQVITWGSSLSGARDVIGAIPRLSSGVRQIFSCGDGFAAVLADGSAISWRSRDQWLTIDANSEETRIKTISSTNYAFAALRENGSVSTWGDSYSGGHSSHLSEKLSQGVRDIYSSLRAFAALKSDGSVVTWGDELYGGSSISVSQALKSGVSKIFSTAGAFAALKIDGSVITWGDPNR
jgi:alpha-tubulin suppressor-like RCC1 family protein